MALDNDSFLIGGLASGLVGIFLTVYLMVKASQQR